MGVHGLWKLLLPVGRRISIETLSRRTLAVDMSIWLTQFIKAMRDDDGRLLKNAHLLGTFRRLCKLLFHRIKPVMVFDGAAPMLKRRTMEKRRAARERNEQNVTKAAQRLLFARLKQARAEHKNKSGGAAADTSFVPGFNAPQPKPSTVKSRTPKHNVKGTAKGAREEKGGSSDPKGSGATAAAEPKVPLVPPLAVDLTQDDDNEDEVEWESEEELAAAKGIAVPSVEYKADSDGSGDAEDDGGVLILPSGGDVDPETLASLPPLLRKEVIEAAHRNRRLQSRQAFLNVAAAPNLYSQTQISNFLKHCKLNNKVKEASALGKIQAQMLARRGRFSRKGGGGGGGGDGDDGYGSDVSGGGGGGSGDGAAAATHISESANRRRHMVLAPIDGGGGGDEIDGGDKTSDSDGDGGGGMGGFFADMEGLDAAAAPAWAGGGSGGGAAGAGAGKEEEEDAAAKRKRETEILQARLQDRLKKKRAAGLLSTAKGGPLLSGSRKRKRPLEDPNKKIKREAKMARKQFRRQILSDMRALLSEKDAEKPKPKPKPATPTQTQTQTQPKPKPEGDGDRTSDSSSGSDFEAEGEAEARTFLGFEPKPNPASSPKRSPRSSPKRQRKAGGPTPGDLAMLQVESVEIDLADIGIPGAVLASTPMGRGGASADTHESPTKAKLRLDADFGADVEDILAESKPQAGEGSGLMAAAATAEGFAAPGQANEGELNSDAYQRALDTASKMANWAGRVVRRALKDKLKPAAPASARSGAASSSGSSLRRTATAESVSSTGTGSASASASLKRAAPAESVSSAGTSVVTEHVDLAGDDIDVELISVDSDGPALKPKASASAEPAAPRHATPGNGSVDDVSIIADGGGAAKASEPDASAKPKPNAAPIDISSLVDGDHVRAGPVPTSINANANPDTSDTYAFLRELGLETPNANANGRPRQQQSAAELDAEAEAARQARNKATRNADTVTEEMQDQVKELLEIFGVPYIVAPAEAEAQCAELERLGLVDGVVTEDSDSFPFGADMVYKNIFEDKKFVEAYSAADCAGELGLSRGDFIALALLLGCDYCDGVHGVGIVNAMEVIRTWPANRLGGPGASLAQFRRWLEGFDFGAGLGLDAGFEDLGVDLTEEERARIRAFAKSHKSARMRWTVGAAFPEAPVIHAFTAPTVSKDRTAFSWAPPDMKRLVRYCADVFGWPVHESLHTLGPLVKALNATTVQTRVDSYFRYEENKKAGVFRSKRLQDAVAYKDPVVHHPLDLRKGAAAAAAEEEEEARVTGADREAARAAAGSPRRRATRATIVIAIARTIGAPARTPTPNPAPSA